MFLVIAFCAVLCTIPRVLRSLYFWDRDAVESRLNSMESISNVQVQGHDDLTYEVHAASFCLKGRPDAQITISISSPKSLTKTGHLRLSSIGPWRFCVHGYGYVGVGNSKTGAEIKSKFFGGSIDIGQRGRFGHLMPCEITSIDDVIANYDRLVEFFADWPDESDPGTLDPDMDTLVRYYKVEKTARPKSSQSSSSRQR
jgi:hypothetical protein